MADRALLERLYVTERKSIPDIARALGMTYYAARVALLNAGIKLRSRSDGVRAARAKLGKHAIGKPRVFSAEHRRNLSASKRARADTTARGVSLKPNGYLEITRGPNKHRHLHTVLMEQHIGRRLAKGEVVHHIDGERTNNDLSNLQLMTRAEHTRHHRREQGATHGKR